MLHHLQNKACKPLARRYRGHVARIAIYALFDSRNPKELVYIGQSVEVSRRFETHLSGCDKATQEWIKTTVEQDGIVRLVILEMVRSKAAAFTEAKWICRLQPKLNSNSKIQPELVATPCETTFIYWPEGNQFFRSNAEAGRFFGIHASAIGRALNHANGEIFWSAKNKNIKLEWRIK